MFYLSIQIFQCCKPIWDLNTMLLLTLYIVLLLEIEPLHMKCVWSLFIHCYSLPNFCHHQIVVGITVCCPEWLDIKYTWMPSSLYQNMVNLIVAVPIWNCPSIFIDIAMWEHCTFANEIFDVSKFTTLTPLSLLISCKHSFRFVCLKTSSLPTLSFKSLSFIHCWGMNIQYNNMKPATCQYYVWQPITNKLNPLNCWYDSVLCKNPVPNSWFSFPFP
jgi:hypothetical protein